MIGVDGAACNNTLDMFQEMRLAALLQSGLGGLGGLSKDNPGGVGALTANEVLSMATVDGATALGLDDEIGSIEVGKSADLVILDLDAVGTSSIERPADIVAAIVYAARPENVETVMVQGRILLDHGTLRTVDGKTVDQEALVARAVTARRTLLSKSERHRTRSRALRKASSP